ncbi:5-hydroxytryptamine receptor 2C-like [Triplophysa rosa]|uniref:5-hydroxytryptamine receptor 2C-like n=1 Tax=Triplophysa rosa TaxID=992332 RepID=UPI002545CD44|nr:5-hydroxytryptamine receptor 2C-like [Triplophysa rosa]
MGCEGTVKSSTRLLSLPIPVMGFQDMEKVFVNGTLNEPWFVLVGSFIAFFIPLVIMVVCYYLTLCVLHQQCSAFPQETKGYSKCSSAQTGDTSLLNNSSSSQMPTFLLKKHQVSSEDQGRRGMMKAIRNEQRVCKVLGIVFFLFLVMWCPFFTTNVVIAVCQYNCEHLEQLMNVFVLVGYVSSGVNPLIYTLFNKTYRHAFSLYLQCKYHRDIAKGRKSTTHFR